MNKPSLIELIFDEMGANKSMIYRIQLNKKFLLENESIYRDVANSVESVSNWLEEQVQTNVLSFNKKLEDFKAGERNQLSKMLIENLKESLIKTETFLNDKYFLELKIFNQSLAQLRQKIDFVEVDLSKIVNCQSFDAIDLNNKMELVYSSYRTLSKIILQQLQVYNNFQRFFNQEVYLFCQITMMDKDLKNFDVAYSYDQIDHDNFAYMNSEIYRIVKNKIIPDFKKSLDSIKNEYEKFFSVIKDNNLFYFLQNLDSLNLKKDQLLRNDFLYFLLSTNYYLELINKFKEAENKIYKKVFQLNNTISKIQPLNQSLPRPLSDAELMILLISQLLDTNFVKFMMLSDADYSALVNQIVKNIFKSEIPYGAMLQNVVLPYKMFKMIKKDNNLKIWDLWRHEFVVKNFKGKKDETSRFILTGKEIVRKKETLQEAIFIHLSDEHIASYKEFSKQVVLERVPKIIIQDNMKIDSNHSDSFKINVQFSFVLENSIIVASNLKFN